MLGSEEPVWTSGADFSNKPPFCCTPTEKTGYGLFNVLLLLATTPVILSSVLSVTSSPFILQSTECIFELTWSRKGFMVAMPFIAMAIMGPLWELFLQHRLINYFGKRNIIKCGIVLDLINNVLASHANNYWSFLLYKFISGVLNSGPLSLAISYLTEFHDPRYQKDFTKWTNLLLSACNIVAPALAVFFAPRYQYFSCPSFFHSYESWRIYLLICSIPSVVGVFAVFFLPNDPKYLINQSREKQLIRLVKSMHYANKFKAADKDAFSEQLWKIKREGAPKFVEDLKLLLSAKYAKSFLKFIFLQFLSMLEFNGMRLWVPQMFVMLNNYNTLLKPKCMTKPILMCDMLLPGIPYENEKLCTYTLPDLESAVYVNSTIIAFSAVTFAFIFTTIAVDQTRQKLIAIFAFLLCCSGAVVANWAVKIPYMLSSCALVVVTSRIASNSLTAYNNAAIPNNLKFTSACMSNFVGNVASSLGSVLFSIFIEINCIAAFIGLGALSFVASLLTLFLKKPEISNKESGGVSEIKKPTEVYRSLEPKY